MPDRTNPDAAYLIQADTERKQLERASAELLWLLRKYHPQHDPRKHRLDAGKKSA